MAKEIIDLEYLKYAMDRDYVVHLWNKFIELSGDSNFTISDKIFDNDEYGWAEFLQNVEDKLMEVADICSQKHSKYDAGDDYFIVHTGYPSIEYEPYFVSSFSDTKDEILDAINVPAFIDWLNKFDLTPEEMLQQHIDIEDLL